MNRNALNRITTLAISWVVMLTAGSLFTFSSFARGFEERLKLDSSQMNLISGIGMAGLYVPCLFMGILYDKYGARITMAVGTLAFSLGYLLMWVVFDKMRSFQYSFILIAILYFITGIGSSAGYIVW